MRWSYSDGDYRKGDGLNPGEVPLGPTRERRAGKWKERYGVDYGVARVKCEWETRRPGWSKSNRKDWACGGEQQLH